MIYRCKVNRMMLYKNHMPLRPILAPVVVLLLFLPAAFMPLAHTPEQQQVDTIEDLWIDIRIGPPLIPLFNEAARDNDIARVDHPSQVEQLAGIEAGRKMIIFKSVAEAEELLPDMARDIDIVGYNLEHNPGSPEEDKADPVGSIRAMRELADEYGLDLAFGPDHDFARSHGVEIAPFVDIFVLQVQRQQTRPAIVEDFVFFLVPKLREANPDLEVSVQVRTEGDVEGIVELLDSLKEHLDGVSILTSPDTVDVAWELVAALRPYVTIPAQGNERTALYALAASTVIALGAGALLIRRRRD